MSENTLTASVKWIDGLTFVAESGSGHQTVLDGNAPGTAPSPMEMVLMAAGSCASVDVVNILEKARQQVVQCECQVSAERVGGIPNVFKSIHLQFIVTGHNVAEQHVQRAVQLSAEKYCSVAKMLEASVEMQHSYTIKTA
ncbi:OsmC family protein [Idiomarina seosinensis]|uniref:OsmC family protein n=1 Tax=Idiomarina seosinensis TaxID=281739 RepID=UPI00384AD0A1